MAKSNLKCLTCGKPIIQGGNRPKKYCDSTCRSIAWHREAAKAKAKVSVKDLTKPSSGKAKDLTRQPPKTNFTINNLPPERKKGEGVLEFAQRKNEWKRRQNK